MKSLQFLPVLLQFAPVAARIYEEVSTALADGEISADEAAELGRQIGSDAGKLIEVKVKGQDVFHGPAGGDLGAGIARIARQIHLAAKA